MKPSMLSKLDQLAERIVEINALLAREDATANLDQYRKLTREHAELEPVVAQFAAWKQAEEDIATAQELAADPDMKAFAEDELRAARERMESSKANCNVCCCQKTRTTTATSSWKSAQARAAMNPRSLPATCCACTRATPNGSAGRWRS